MGHVYIATNKKNGKSYIGQTVRSIHKRLKEHQLESSRCRAFAGAIKKYGWKNFQIEWYECSVDELNKHEKWMIRLMGTLSPGGYNLKEGGENGKMSEETKKKMSESKLGHDVSEETKKKISESLLGHDVSDETKKKISESLLGEKNYNFGKTPSDEIRQKISESMSGEKNHMWGEHHSDETRQKMSEAHRGEKNYKSKRVYQYHLDGTFIGSFGSTGEAARHLNKPNGDGNIRACASGGRKTAHKFRWSYEGWF